MRGRTLRGEYFEKSEDRDGLAGTCTGGGWLRQVFIGLGECG